MKLDFKAYKLEETSKQYKQLMEHGDNEFIIVGDSELEGCFSCQQLPVMLIGGLNIVECALLIKKDDLVLDCDDFIYTIDIPKKNLTLEIVDNIKRLNE